VHTKKGKSVENYVAEAAAAANHSRADYVHKFLAASTPTQITNDNIFGGGPCPMYRSVVNFLLKKCYLPPIQQQQ